MTIKFKNANATKGVIEIEFCDNGRGWCEASNGKRTAFNIADIVSIEED